MEKSPREIIFKPEAFFTCLNSAIEVYKRETFGFLFSNKDKNTIDFAYTPQTAERKFNGANAEKKRIEHLVDLMEKDFGLIRIGIFHSHSDGWYQPFCTLSKDDAFVVKKNSPDITLLFDLFSYNGKLKIIMKGYYYDKKQNWIRLAKLIPSRRLEYMISKDNPSLLRLFGLKAFTSS
jgi:proteasome lid subunit RPN8/RPN11